MADPTLARDDPRPSLGLSPRLGVDEPSPSDGDGDGDGEWSRRGHADPMTVVMEAAVALHAEADLDSLLTWVLDAVHRLTGLTGIGVCLFDHETPATWTSHPDASVNLGLLGDPRSVPLVATALDLPRGVVYEDVAAAESAMPPPDRIRRIVAVDGLVVVPIHAADGLTHGVLMVGWRGATDVVIEEDVRGALAALAAHLGIAIDNHAVLTRMVEEEARGKEVVHRLQQAVRPPAPIVPFTELGVHYVAADPSAPTGGDLYDWIVLPDGSVHLTVVDVMGKGVQATKDALIVTHALRLLAIDGCGLGDIVRRADELVSAQNPELVATLVVARYWPDDGRLQLAGGGHPPALVVRGGEPEEIQAPGIPIGWPGAGSQGVVETSLKRSDTLILYTDGLIEATKDILRGLADLADAARSTAGYPAGSLARVLVDRALSGANRHDDSLALVLRRRSPAPSLSAHVLAPMQHKFSPNPAAVPIARHLLRDWLVRVPVDDEAVDNLLLMASELCSNAVQHATDAEPGAVSLHAWVEGDGVVIEVTDNGTGVELPAVVEPDLPDPEAEQGRGLFLVHELADEVVSEMVDGRSVVRVAKLAVVTDAAR